MGKRKGKIKKKRNMEKKEQNEGGDLNDGLGALSRNDNGVSLANDNPSYCARMVTKSNRY